MKTLVVLSALAAVALAAPTQVEETEDFKKTLISGAEILKRDRKSVPQDATSGSNLTPGEQVDLPFSSQHSESATSARSFALKKPIIIKKKQGHHHVYRDSDEEQVESGESCGKQVKVKLCEDKSEQKMRSSTIEDMNAQLTEEDMKHSIKLAKEAVENLQRDLKIVERKPGAKATAWKHGQSESDAELHQDIEVAREALEHIHKNFGNLESMSLHATTLENADTIQDSHLAIAKTEEQRLAQWKEAMDTIHKNFEIARNIEDSFKAKAASGETGLLLSDDIIDHENKHGLNKMTDFMRATEDVAEKEEKVKSKTCKTDLLHEKSSEKDNIKSGPVEDDMTSSASTMSEQKIEQKLEKAREAPELSTEIQQDKSLQPEKPLENTHKEKDADMETVLLQNLFQKNSEAVEPTKTIDETKERKPESESQTKKHSATETITDSLPEATNKMKSVETEDILLEQRQTVANTHEQPHQSLKPEDHMSKIEKTEKKNLEMKFAEQVNQQHNDVKKNEDKTQNIPLQIEQAREDNTMTFMKSAEQNPADKQKQLLEHEHAVNEHGMNTDQLEHHLNKAKTAQEEALKHQTENIAPNNVQHAKTHEHLQSLTHPKMREVEDLNSMHQRHHHHHHHQTEGLPQTRWAEDKNHHLQMEAMKAADGIPSQSMHHDQNMQHPGHHHHLAHGMKSHHFDTNGHERLHPRFPDNFAPQGKSADMDMQSYYMSMRDGSGSGPEGHRFRWRPMHESARSAYGAPAAAASSSSGAVGVFPNAKAGGCGIPLLLSCNPSVVSGNLASPHPAPYSAPAYRTEDDFSFHTKRDVKKAHENLPSSLHRTPSNVNLKTGTVLVAKQ